MYSGNAKNGRTVLRTHRYPMLSLFDEVNRFFEDAVPAARSYQTLDGFNPPIDVTETEKEYLIRGEFPGIDSSAVQIELRDNTLTLSGEKRQESEKTEGTKHYVERTFGSFSRTIRFDAEVDEANSIAEMKNGVLTVKIPKAAKEIKGAKRLTIKSS